MPGSGRSSGGGYLYINWDGKVMPCVFVPYSPVNLNDIYKQGKTIADAWEESFFERIRTWQAEYLKGDQQRGNLLNPCFIRDHQDVMRQIIADTEPDPENDPAREALLDKEYAKGMIEYGKAIAEATQPVWEKQYLKLDESTPTVTNHPLQKIDDLSPMTHHRCDPEKGFSLPKPFSCFIIQVTKYFSR